MERRVPITVAEAIRKVMGFANNGLKELLPIELAYGRILAEDLVADHDVPSFNRSPYDGFAIRAEDTNLASYETSIVFEVMGEIGAGSLFHEKVGPFQAVRIMTGAQIPNGCDAVVMLELTRQYEKNGNNYMEVKRSFKTGENISFQGEDARKGTVLAKKGSYINPGISALLATFGYSEVPVARKPVIGLLATGSELLDVNDSLQPGKIRNSNTYMILSQIRRAGGRVKYFGKFSDDFNTCFTVVKEALGQVDMLITTGGVSVGDYDYLPAIYEKLGASVLFNKVAMRPGSVTTVAQLNGKLLFGLSGNPSACYVGFELFVRPCIRTYMFSEKVHLKREKALLGEDFLKPNPFTRFVRAKLQYDEGKLIAYPSGFDKSSSVSSLAESNAFIVLPGGTRGYKKDMFVDVLLLEDNEGSEWPWTFHKVRGGFNGTSAI
ncbi:molybdopterin molybdenumtransferase MoeA [Bacillus toyonensis]|uniref:Molybdopterin molybdenumtransferase n=1 Tax=Bacillus toyonensis TaxID=155322 RepID=A0AB36T1Z1_9BACI|nr:gephyrin-like molybdotransferase Glp [Bacillus toyonensis]EEL59893.1 Amino acid permease domain protein [Bacillus cereus Rock4-18]PEC11661.1 molybdopterin molybdenumtransferase MoeA [Bacillus toyonensis]PED93697.1 molybdopterin molybdenumtransferase MoeA [Bacillus toyonensis]PEJ63264.1 molybdopterin molybdenumtransferase MoeA [Bacillus toyonensis]PEK49601.1 molybdopterin molybdenumtransferase MoeA [Bacillus toyonensis]